MPAKALLAAATISSAAMSPSAWRLWNPKQSPAAIEADGFTG
ncbi:UNVERIFIED_ORG: hypothetical protein M2438_003430 [Methylobacterium sp. SuP10 SLI 274]|nr:hypothetical protein [Methylorubrum pseudosasae]MDH6638255.1 hypothetical protein [Methylobacterium sp. SuP10 SLI 274]MDH6667435.1 hypothetical protein [Methylorubrum zatmanii]